MKLRGSNLMIFSKEQMAKIVEDWCHSRLSIANTVESVVYSEREYGFIVEFSDPQEKTV